jgi:hypothetical protein
MTAIVGYFCVTAAVACASVAALTEFGQHVAAMYAAINVALQAAGAGG